MESLFRFVADSIRATARHFTTFEPMMQIGVVAMLIALFVAWRWGVGFAKTSRDLKWQQQRIELLSRLLERGIPADESVRVLTATLGASHSDASKLTKAIAASATGIDLESLAGEGASDPTARIVKVLAENGFEADEIEQVLLAARKCGPIDTRTVAIVTPLAENGAEADGIAKVLAAGAGSTGSSGGMSAPA